MAFLVLLPPGLRVRSRTKLRSQWRTRRGNLRSYRRSVGVFTVVLVVTHASCVGVLNGLCCKVSLTRFLCKNSGLVQRYSDTRPEQLIL